MRFLYVFFLTLFFVPVLANANSYNIYVHNNIATPILFTVNEHPLDDGAFGDGQIPWRYIQQYCPDHTQLCQVGFIYYQPQIGDTVYNLGYITVDPIKQTVLSTYFPSNPYHVVADTNALPDSITFNKG